MVFGFGVSTISKGFIGISLSMKNSVLRFFITLILIVLLISILPLLLIFDILMAIFYFILLLFFPKTLYKDINDNSLYNIMNRGDFLTLDYVI